MSKRNRKRRRERADLDTRVDSMVGNAMLPLVPSRRQRRIVARTLRDLAADAGKETT